jgi:hypothetical protein
MRAYNLNWILKPNSFKEGNPIIVPTETLKQGKLTHKNVRILYLTRNFFNSFNIRAETIESSIIFKNWGQYRRFYKSERIFLHSIVFRHSLVHKI